MPYYMQKHPVGPGNICHVKERRGKCCINCLFYALFSLSFAYPYCRYPSSFHDGSKVRVVKVHQAWLDDRAGDVRNKSTDQFIDDRKTLFERQVTRRCSE